MKKTACLSSLHAFRVTPHPILAAPLPIPFLPHHSPSHSFRTTPHPILAPPLPIPFFPHHSPSHSCRTTPHPIHWDQTKELFCWSLGSRPTQVQELLTLVARLVETASCCLSACHKNCYLQETSEDTSLLGFSTPRHQHPRWPVAVMKLLHQFCCWTPIRLSYH